MNKIFLFLPLFLFAEFINFPYTFSLKKDEIKSFIIYYKKFEYPLKIRWTLFKNDFIIVHYNFNNFPRQTALSKNYPLDAFKINLTAYERIYPYLYIKFVDFNDKIATFKIDLFNSKSVKVEEIK